jgi:uncharacterized protein (DUF885 family)
MFDRRNMLKTGSAAVALAITGVACSKETPAPAPAPAPGVPAAATPPATGKAAEINKLYDTFMTEFMDRSPEFVTNLGLDKGPRAAQKAQLGDRSLAQIARDKARNTSQLQRLEALGRDGLTGNDAIGYDVVHYALSTGEVQNQRYNFGNGGAGVPYVVNQFGGTYQNIPDFLDSQHTIENKADADAYLSRMAAFATALDQDVEVMRHDAGIGVIPPDFAINRTLELLATMRKPAAGENSMVKSIARRTKEKNIPGEWTAQATRLVEEKVYPAVDRHIAMFRELLPKSVHDAGVWRLPQGDQYYADSLVSWATTDMKPAEIHQIGLNVIEDHTRRVDELMKANGYSQGTVGQRFAAMYKDPKFHYPNTDAGREKLIADLNVLVTKINAELPKFFGVLAKAPLVIKRVPPEIEAGQAGGYYQNPSLDGSRPGTYYINLRDTKEQPTWSLPTLTVHEGNPGHHFQIAIQQEANLPLIRKVLGYSAYSEGWALYTEQLAADEMGLYANDSLGHIGQLHDAMFRGVRLVVDTGMHAMKWSRERAIKYYMDTIGDSEKATTTEIERYAVWPGQACSYMLGKITFVRLRQKAERELGSRFDIKSFHDTVLTAGGLPLKVLEAVVDNYIAARKA